MFEVLRNFLTTASYTIEDGQGRIDYAVGRGKITPEQAQELAQIVETRGTPDAITPKSLDERVSDIELAIIDLAGMVAALLGGGMDVETEIAEEITVEVEGEGEETEVE